MESSHCNSMKTTRGQKAPDPQHSLLIAELDPVYLELFLLWFNPDKSFCVFQCCSSRSGIWDPVPFWPRDPGWVKIRIQIWDEQPKSYFRELKKTIFWVKILKFFDVDPGSGMDKIRIRDPGWNKVGPGIRNKHPGSATLVFSGWCDTHLWRWLSTLFWGSCHHLPTLRLVDGRSERRTLQSELQDVAG